MNSNATPRRLGVVLAVASAAIATTLGITSAPAQAGLGLACPNPVTRPFAPWGDYAQYAFVPNGGFEAGSSGWTLSGRATVAGSNEPFFVSGDGDHSLSLPAGSSATSTPMCISILSGKMRFFIGGAAGSTVRVQIIYRGLLSSIIGILDGGTVTSSGVWQPSRSMLMLGGLLPILTQSVQFRLTALDGAAYIDDVYLDPWKVT